jgi:hypothetical protein
MADNDIEAGKIGHQGHCKTVDWRGATGIEQLIATHRAEQRASAAPQNERPARLHCAAKVDHQRISDLICLQGLSRRRAAHEN